MGAASAGAVELPPILASGGEGSLSLSGTEPFNAGAEETYRFTFEVGPSGLAAGGGFLILDPILHGMRLTRYADWTLDPAECNDLFQPEGADPSRYEGLLWAEIDNGSPALIERPEPSELEELIHQEMYTAVTVDQALPAGATITLTIGMTEETPLGPAQPVCSTRAPYRAFEHIKFPAASRSDADAGWAMLDSQLPVMHVDSASTEPVVRVLLPGTAQVGEAIPVRLVLLDAFGNPLEGYAGSATIEPSLQVDGLPASLELDGAEGGVVWLEGTALEPGVLRVAVDDVIDTSVLSNPCLVTADEPEFHLLWGDIHSHHGVSHRDGGQVVDENLRYARDVAGLDFAGESMKLPPFEVDGEALWEELQLSCESYEEHGFLPVLGFEWMGGIDNGHHNVYFDGCWGDVRPLEDIPDLAGEDGLWAYLDELALERPDVRTISVPHASRYTGCGWEPVNDRYRPLAEVQSEWGESLSPDGSTSVTDGILAGNTMGFVAGSDNHDGFMGNPLAEGDAKGGLTCVLSRGRTRDDLFSAFQARSTFATHVERMILLVRSVEGDYSAVAGEQLVGFAPALTIELHGTQPLQSVQLHRLTLQGTPVDEVVWEQLPGPSVLDGEWTVDTGDPGLAFDGSTAFYVHAVQSGEGQAWSSPIYLDPSCDGSVADPAGLCGGDDDDDSAVSDDDDDDSAASDDDDGGCDCDHGRSACGVADASILLLLTAWYWRRR